MSTLTPEPWSYEPPRTPESHPTQRYYRTAALTLDGSPFDTAVELLRFAPSENLKLKLRLDATFGTAHLDVPLTRTQLKALRDACNDALHEIAQEDGERERAASFERINEEMREAEERGEAHGCYYGHPDIHYVPASAVPAKVRELEAAGCKRYMVLAEPGTEPGVREAA
jgi:hypothetical protein